MDSRFDVVASGSLLGIDYKRASSYPVGYVEFLEMNGMDFEEFLWGNEFTLDKIATLRACFDSRMAVPPAVNSQMMLLYRTYVAIGGMPEAVQTFIDTKDFRTVHKVQGYLLKGYLYDIAHYATASEKIKAEKCFLSLGKQLLEKENHKFKYSEVEHNGKAQKFLSSVEWLTYANIAKVCTNVSKIAYNLVDYEIENNFRVYTSDLSLLVAMRDFELKQRIVENSLVSNSKGGVYECAVADALIKNGYELHFYRNETNRKEIDFLVQKNGYVIPIEVKAGNATSKSLRDLMKNHAEIPLAYKLADANVGCSEERVLTVPLYMSMFL